MISRPEIYGPCDHWDRFDNPFCLRHCNTSRLPLGVSGGQMEKAAGQRRLSLRMFILAKRLSRPDRWLAEKTFGQSDPD